MAEVPLSHAEAVISSREVLDAVGLAAVGYFQSSFDRQSFGSNPWPERYPFQLAPTLNVAAALERFNRGLQPLARHYESWPVLKGSGDLQRSITHRVSGDDEIEVGADPAVAPYASLQNFGGKSRQPVTDLAKKRIRSFVKRKPAYAKHLRPLLAMDEKITNVIGREFIGVTPELESHLAGVLADAIEKEAKRRDR